MKAWTNKFYYITHLNNVNSILSKGILSHNLVEKSNISPNRISDQDIVNSRKEIETPAKKSLWDYANVYFRPKNAMLYKMIQSFGRDNIVILSMLPSIIRINGSFLTTGNARSPSTEIKHPSKIREVLKELYPYLIQEWWGDPTTKIKIMAECLVPDLISPEYIKEIYVANQESFDRINQRNANLIQKLKINVVPEENLFYTPESIIEITDKLSLVKGDMLFSDCQTLTVSVNTIGVMGAGLAASVKYHFPDVFNYYNKLCLHKNLVMGEPQLYKRKFLYGNQLLNTKCPLPWSTK